MSIEIHDTFRRSYDKLVAVERRLYVKIHCEQPFFFTCDNVRSVIGEREKERVREKRRRKCENNDQPEVPEKSPHTPLVQLSHKINEYNSFDSDCSTLQDGLLMN